LGVDGCAIGIERDVHGDGVSTTLA
jgi:hypothetical protein